MSESSSRVIAWFSHGITSTVALQLTLAKYGARVRAVTIDTGSENEDNERYRSAVEGWLGVNIEVLHSAKYVDVDDVIRRTRYLRGPKGARCSGELKKAVRYAYQKPDDLQIFGFHAKEKRRAARFTKNNIDIDLEYPLIDAGLTKDDCHRIVEKAGIQAPLMYALGFNNNNCIGCVKAEGAGYWNRTRIYYPDVFQRRAEQERVLGYALVRVKRQPIFLDELDPSLGLSDADAPIECGLLCS